MSSEIVKLHDFYGIWIVHVKGVIDQNTFQSLPHSHEHHELFVHISGEMDIYAENNLYHLSGGEIRLYAAGELHGGILKSNRAEWFQICIPPAFSDFPESAPLTAIFTDRKYGQDNVFVSKKQETIIQLLNGIFSYIQDENPLRQTFCKSALIQVLCYLNHPNERIKHEKRNVRVLNEAIRAINTNFADLETVDDLCKFIHYSASYINRLFRDNLNITPYQFLLGKKLNEAKNALKSGKTVTEAAEYAGFHSYTNFITLFRKRFGITPNKYRS